MKVNEILTSKFIEALKAGVCPWHRPWHITGLRNGLSKKLYRGVNIFILAALSHDCYFFTRKQINALGGKIKKGGKLLPIAFFKFLQDKDASGKVTKSFPMLRYYGVYGLSDTEGMKWKEPEDKKIDFVPVEMAEKFIAAQGAVVEFTGDRACYVPNEHKIFMPKRESFNSIEEFYATMFHELTHWASKSVGVKLEGDFASKSYSKEELVAELGSAFLANFCGIDISKTFNNSAAYLGNWLSALQNDHNLIISASSQAQKRFDEMMKKFDPTYTVNIVSNDNNEED